MKTLLLVTLFALGTAACAARSSTTPVAHARDTTVSSAPTCKEIPNLVNKPARCEAVPPSILRP